MTNRVVNLSKKREQGCLVALLLLFNFVLILPAMGQSYSFLPKDKGAWGGYTISVIPAPFQEDQNVTIQVDSISTLPTLTKSLNSGEIYRGIRISLPGRAGYFDLMYSNQNNDTLFIEQQTVVSSVERAKKENEIKEEMSRIVANKLKKYSSGFFRRKINSYRLKEAILSGEILKRDTTLFRSNQKFSGLSKIELDSFYFEGIPAAFDWKNKDLVSVYLKEAQDQGVSFNKEKWMTASKHIAYSIFMKTPFENKKSKLEELLNQSVGQNSSSFETALALWYAYYFFQSGGLSVSNSNPNAYSIEEIKKALTSVGPGLYKKSFMIFLESLNAVDPLKQDYTFLNINEEQITITKLVDKEWVLLDFWATWCQPCIKAFPELAAFYSEYKNNFNLLSISVDNDYGDFSRWAKRHEQKYKWPFLHATQSHPIVSNMKVRAYPSYFLIKVKTGETLGPIHKVSELRQVFEHEQKTINH